MANKHKPAARQAAKRWIILIAAVALIVFALVVWGGFWLEHRAEKPEVRGDAHLREELEGAPEIQIDGKTYLEEKDFPVISNPGMAAEPIKLSGTEYFVLGDNRNNSEDSRFADVGLVSSDMIEGKVWFVLSPAAHRGFLKS